MDPEDCDKNWASTYTQKASNYILGPLTAPEPSQISGIAAPRPQPARQLSSNSQNQSAPLPSPGTSPKKRGFFANALKFRSKGKRPEPIAPQRQSPAPSALPTPPGSASPTQAHFGSEDPFTRVDSDHDSDFEIIAPQSHLPLPPSRAEGHLRICSDPQRCPGSNLYDPAPYGPTSRPNPGHRRYHSQPNPGVQYQLPLRQRYPGDMSHRPLEGIRRDVRAADRGHRRGASTHHTDVIDALDTIGGTYHHGGPYDATLASRNVHQKYSPVAAVQHSNQEAIRATPREFIQDSLEHHVPLQGTAVIPPGGIDPRGRRMDYEEGADLMREPDAAGGPYKRWADVRYHPDDLKGKGEPSYTLERDLKQKQRYINPAGEYELQSPRVSRLGRPRRRSSGYLGDDSLPSGSGSGSGIEQAGSVQRSNTTGKRLSDGFRRRMGSLRKKPVATSQEVN